MIDSSSSLQILQRRLGIVAVLYALGFVALGMILRLQINVWELVRWLGLSALLGVIILIYLHKNLSQNKRPGQTRILPSLGPGTTLSLFGAWCLAAMGGFIVISWPSGALAWLPALLFLLALLSDLFDGYLARKTNHVTELGQASDMAIDGMGVLLTTLLVIAWGQWPAGFVIVGLARYLFIWGLAWRERRSLPTRELTDSVIRRLLAGMQRGFLFVAMWPIAPAWLATATGLAFVVPFLLNFIYDWLVTSAFVDPTTPDYQRLLTRWRRWAYGPIALGIRLLSAGAMAVMIWQSLTHWDALRTGLNAAGIPDEIAFFLVGIGFFLTPLLTLGVAPRLTAMLLYIPAGFILLSGISFWSGLVGIYGLTAVILLGPGPFALWQPEARAFTQRLGS